MDQLWLSGTAIKMKSSTTFGSQKVEVVSVVHPPSLCQHPYVLATGNLYSVLRGGNEFVVTATSGVYSENMGILLM